MNAWLTRVTEYLAALESCNERLNEALDETRFGTRGLDTGTIATGTEQLTLCLKELETQIAARQALLDADDAPLKGVSLRDILNRLADPAANDVAKRCEQISKAIDLTRERTVSLFVCQFQLGDLSAQLLAILRTGADHGVTYAQGQSEVKRTQVSGSVFNRAA